MLRKLFLVSHPTNIKLSLHNYNTSMLSAFFGRWATQRPTKQRQSKTKAKQKKAKLVFQLITVSECAHSELSYKKIPIKKFQKLMEKFKFYQRQHLIIMMKLPLFSEFKTKATTSPENKGNILNFRLNCAFVLLAFVFYAWNLDVPLF